MGVNNSVTMGGHTSFILFPGCSEFCAEVRQFVLRRIPGLSSVTSRAVGGANPEDNKNQLRKQQVLGRLLAEVKQVGGLLAEVF